MTRLVLASQSRFRASLLRNAGIAFETRPADIDEGVIKTRMRAAQAPAAEVAEALAGAKAILVSQSDPEALVIGADQMLVCAGAWLDKPANRDEARASLAHLRGRRHQLLSAVCLAQGGEIVWRNLETAHLTMRAFSGAFLEHYLERVGEDVSLSVGAYQLEGLGGQLFEAIEGDYFCILGLPLLPLLAELRRRQVVMV